MSPAEFAASMRSVSQFLHKLDVVQNVRSFHTHAASTEFKRAALTAPVYPDLYLLGLEKGDYNVLLTDFSYLQFARISDGANVSLRYAYYPNPFDTITYDEFVLNDQDGDGSESFEDYIQYLQGTAFRNAVPVIRYDYAQQDYREYSHPAAHLHFGLHADNRWAVSFRLTPLVFVLQITKMFYGDIWHSVVGGEPAAARETLLCAAKKECVEIEDAYFTHGERRQLHFG